MASRNCLMIPARHFGQQCKRRFNPKHRSFRLQRGMIGVKGPKSNPAWNSVTEISSMYDQLHFAKTNDMRLRICIYRSNCFNCDEPIRRRMLNVPWMNYRSSSAMVMSNLLEISLIKFLCQTFHKLQRWCGATNHHLPAQDAAKSTTIFCSPPGPTLTRRGWTRLRRWQRAVPLSPQTL